MPPGDAPIDEDARRRFEAERIGGGLGPIEAFLPPADAPTYAATLEELLAIDLEFRWRRWSRDGAPPDAAPTVEDADPAARLAPDAVERLARENQRLRARFAAGLRARAGARLGRYELRERVGRGAFAEVWRAWDEELRRDVAVKLPREDLADDPTVLARLVREARSAAQLRHPAIVTVHEVGQEGGRPYVVSDFVDGPTLARAMQDRRFEPDAAARIVLQIAEALDYAHAFGVVHRDVKPGNVLMTAQGAPVLADFGLAQLRAAETALTRQGEVVGTPAYMSPEQARGDGGDAGPKSDVYSLGVVLYELLAGALPFRSAGTQGVLYAVVHEEPPSPRTFAPKLPLDLETICLKAMAKEPDRRYAGARALAEDLRRHLDRRPILARPIGPWERVRLWARRNPALATTIGVSAAAILVGGSFALSRVLDERRRYREERDRANVQLYCSLVTEASALHRLRDSEWRARALDALRQASALDVPSRDVRALRDLVLACESSVYPSFRLVARRPSLGGAATSLAASPKGSLVAAATEDGTLWTRRADDGEVVASAPPRGAKPTRVAFVSEDLLAVGAADGTLRLADARSPASSAETTAPGAAVTALAASPAGDLVAAARDDGRVDVWRVDADARRLAPVQTLAGHDGPALSVAFSSDGARLATGGEDRWIRLWDLSTGRVQSAQRLADAPRALAYHPSEEVVAWCAWENGGWGLTFFQPGLTASAFNGVHLSAARTVTFFATDRALTSSADGTLRLFATRSGELLAVAQPEAGPVACAAAAPGGTRVTAVHADGEVLLWDLDEPPDRVRIAVPETARFVPGTTRCFAGDAAFDLGDGGRAARRPLRTPAVRTLASIRGGFAWGTADGNVRLRRAGAEPPRLLRDAAIASLAASADGTTLAFAEADGDLSTIRVADAACQARGAVPEIGPVRAVGFGDGGSLVAAGERGVVVVGADGSRRTLASGPRGPGAAAVGGGRVAVSDVAGRIDVLDAGSGALVRSIETHAGPLTALALAPDGARLVCASRGRGFRVHLFADAGEIEIPVEGQWPAEWTAVDPASILAARGGVGWADVVDLARGVVVARLATTTSICGAFDGDGTLRLGGSDGGVLEWSRATLDAARARTAAATGPSAAAQCPPLPCDAVPVAGGHRTQVWGVAASPDGKLVASGSHDGEVKLWDADTLELVRDLHREDEIAWTCAFSADSRRLAVGYAEQATVLDVADGREVGRLVGHEKLVGAIAFHPRRPLIVTASGDGSLRLWNAEDCRALGVLHRAPTSVHDAAFSADGSTLAAACADGSVLFWDGFDVGDASPRPPDRRVDTGADAAWAVSFDRAGRLVAAATEHGAVFLWDAKTLAPLARLEGDLRVARSVSFDDAGRFLVVGCYNSASLAWDLPALRTTLASMSLDW